VGRKKLSTEYVKNKFEEESYTPLFEKYLGAFQKLDYICPLGHTESTTWHNWQQGHRCAECAGKKKYTTEFVKEQFEKERYTPLFEEYMNNKQKLEYICSRGHRSFITWDRWQQGHRCAECVGKKKYTTEHVKSKFEEEDYKPLFDKYVNKHQKLEYICSRGHRGFITWSSWQRGSRCQKCYFENNSGENHPNWNPELTDEDRMQDRQDHRLIPGYTEWRKAVFEKDNYTCQICGKRGGSLAAHHLYNWSDYPDLRLDIDNGVTLCHGKDSCHMKFHATYGKKNNTEEQFKEFKINIINLAYLLHYNLYKIGKRYL